MNVQNKIHRIKQLRRLGKFYNVHILIGIFIRGSSIIDESKVSQGEVCRSAFGTEPERETWDIVSEELFGLFGEFRN